MQLVVKFRGLSKHVEMGRTCLENKPFSKSICYDNQNIFMLKLVIKFESKVKFTRLR